MLKRKLFRIKFRVAGVPKETIVAAWTAPMAINKLYRRYKGTGVEILDVS